MDFKEKYQDELNNINPSEMLNQQILNSNISKKKHIKPAYIRYVAAAIICIATIGVAVNFNTISTIAKSIFGTFKIIVGDEEFDFGEMETIEFDFEKFKESGSRTAIGDPSDHPMRYKYYDSYDKCIEETNLPITIINNTSIDSICVTANSDGHWVRTSITGKYDKCDFTMNGRAETTGSTLDSWGFGDRDAKVLEIYEYADGKKAYILDTYTPTETYSDEGYYIPEAIDVTVQIYFQDNCFLQQLYIGGETQEDAINAGKAFLNDIVE